MKIRFNLKNFGIDTSQKRITNSYGNILITATLESILSLITSKYLYNKYEAVEIHHTKFSNITNQYRKYLDYLQNRGIILISESYEKGKHSKLYMFADNFKEYATIKRFIVDNKEVLIENDDVPEIIDKIVAQRIKQDFLCSNIKDDQVEKEVSFVVNGHTVMKFRKYILNEYILFLLRKKDRPIHWKSGRLYTPFVQLSKNIRKDYFYFNKKLTNLDIKRSFPLWLAIWLIEKGIPLDYDTNCFMSSVRSGNIYDDLVQKFNNTKNQFNRTEYDKPFINRNMVKKHFGEWLNGDTHRNNLPNLVFKAYYPSIYELVGSYKDGIKNRMYNELVTMESNFIFNVVCKRLYNEIPGIQLLTCHDEIYFEEDFYNDVFKIWTEELEKVYSKIPTNDNIESDAKFDESELESIGIFLT